MKSSSATFFASAVLLAATALFSSASETSWEDRATGLRDDEGASEWWATTWKTGDHVESLAQYRFYGRLRVRKDDFGDLKWYSIGPRLLETDHEVDIQGTSRCVNNVLQGGKDDTGADASVQIHRSFECPMSARAAVVVGIRNADEITLAIANSYNTFYEWTQKPEIKSAIRRSVEQGKKIAAGAITGLIDIETGGGTIIVSPIIDIGLDHLLNMLDTFATEAAASLNRAAVERLAEGSYDAEGGVEMKKGSMFYRSMPGVENAVENFAVTVNALFDGKDFYLCAARGDRIAARQLLKGKDGKANDALSLFLTNKLGIESLPAAMQDIEPTPDEAKVGDLLSRESLNVNATLFDLRERHPGETWAASATLLNSFLHPDLKGSFRGVICLKYEGDETISLPVPEVADRKFRARHLRMAERVRGTETNFEYYEPPRKDGKGEFRFSYSPSDNETKSEIDIWVDIASGYIIKADGFMEGEVTYLPDLRLVSGWSFKDGKGKVRLEIKSNSWPSRLLKEIK